MAAISELAIATVNLRTKFEVSSLRRYEERYKMLQMGWFGVRSLNNGHWK